MVTDPWFFLLLLVGPLVYWLLPARVRTAFLVALSTGYLATKAPGATAAVVGWTLGFLWAVPRAAAMAPSTRWIGGLIGLILGYLVVFKHLPVIASTLFHNDLERAIVLPLGASYYVFKLVHYAVEVNRNNIAAHTWWDALAWTTMFPAFTAGPIERFDHFLTHREHEPSVPMFTEGTTRLVHGMIKKFVFADGILLRAAELLGSADSIHTASTPRVWAFLFAMYLWGYLDFSAYSDIAIGASRLFGIRLMENFDWPVFANSISTFWKRWHMTLAGWCQVYVYMPFVGYYRNPYVATYLTFLTMGMWHGAAFNWVFWGLFHGTGVATHLTWSRYKRGRKWHKWMDKGWYSYVGIVPTTIFVTAAAAFPTTASLGGLQGLRVFAKLFFISLP